MRRDTHEPWSSCSERVTNPLVLVRVPYMYLLFTVVHRTFSSGQHSCFVLGRSHLQISAWKSDILRFYVVFLIPSRQIPE
jgi:hypothetical protein